MFPAILTVNMVYVSAASNRLATLNRLVRV